MVQDSYPLSQLQQGMLFHHLEARTPGVDVEQLDARLNEPIDTNRFADAWARVAKQNPILRTRFRWEGLRTPVQEVLHEIVVPFEVRDLSDMTTQEQAEALSRFLAEDRSRAFALDVAPLWRATVLHLGADRHYAEDRQKVRDPDVPRTRPLVLSQLPGARNQHPAEGEQRNQARGNLEKFLFSHVE